MYLSIIELDTRKHDTARAIYNPQLFHGALESCFDGGRQHPLWRIDGSGFRMCMMVVSHDAPDFSSFQEQFGRDGTPARSKNYDYFLSNGFRNNDIMRFRFVANPTIKSNGRRIPLNAKGTENHPYSAVDWAKDRLMSHGAEVLDIKLTSYVRKTASSHGKKVHYVMAGYDGVLKVSDAALLKAALSDGIGHEKAYGCGMLSVMHM